MQQPAHNMVFKLPEMSQTTWRLPAIIAFGPLGLFPGMWMIAIVFGFYQLSTSGSTSFSMLLIASSVIAALGLLLAYPLVALYGVPIMWFLRRRNLFNTANVLIAAAIPPTVVFAFDGNTGDFALAIYSASVVAMTCLTIDNWIT